MDQQKIRDILDMWDKGLTASQIADELEISATTVRTEVKRSGRNVHKPKNHPNEAEIVSRYANGAPIPELLQKYGVSYPQLYNMLARNDVPIRRAAQAQGRVKMMETAIEMYEKGVAIWKISQETGVAQPTLHAELHKRGIPLRRPRNVSV